MDATEALRFAVVFVAVLALVAVDLRRWSDE